MHAPRGHCSELVDDGAGIVLEALAHAVFCIVPLLAELEEALVTGLALQAVADDE